MFGVESEILSVNVNVHGYFLGFPITDTILMSVVNLLVILLLCYACSKFTVINPGKFQLAVESIYSMLSGFIEQIAGKKSVADKVMPIVLTLVVFILISNLTSTFLPFLGAFTYNGETLLRSSTNDFNMTLALAFGMVGLTQIFSITNTSLGAYVLKFIKIDSVYKGFRKGIKEGLMSFIDLFLGLLDIVSEFAKIISLSLRLFGNMFAGELLTGIFMSMLAILLPIPIMGLSTLSGVVQSVVFGALVTSYFSGVIE
jgi:F-type H+-transporting ATPase subunit a